MQETKITLEAKQAAIEWDRARDKDHDNFPSILDAFAYGYDARSAELTEEYKQAIKWLNVFVELQDGDSLLSALYRQHGDKYETAYRWEREAIAQGRPIEERVHPCTCGKGFRDVHCPTHGDL